MAWNLFAALRKSPPSAKRPDRRSFRPALEALEDRALPSAVVLIVDSSQSHLTLSGTTTLDGDIMPQGTGSLSTTYTGTLAVDYSAASGTVQLLSGNGTDVLANNSGNWQPNVGGGSGSAAANYGGQLATIFFQTPYAAVRGLHLAPSSASPLTLDPSGSFDGTQVSIAITAGTYDASAGSLGSATGSLAGQSGSNSTSAAATFSANPATGQFALTLPVHFSVTQSLGSFGSATLNIDGQLVAVGVLPVVTLNNGSVPGYNDYAATYDTSVGGPQSLTDPAAAITSQNPFEQLTALTVTLTNNPDGANEMLAVDLSQLPNLSSTYDPSTGILVISGPGTVSDYTAALLNVTYCNMSATPDTADPRVITFVASDALNNSFVSTTTLTLI